MRGKINWLAHAYIHEDGYGRYAIHTVRQLTQLGLEVAPHLVKTLEMPGWMLRMAGIDFSNLTIQCMPGHCMQSVPGRTWGLTMTEDTSCPPEWVTNINRVCERLIVPCEQNAEAFKTQGVKVPLHVVHGGTCPREFPVLPAVQQKRPYTFLCLGDRGNRKGFMVVYDAFFRAFKGVDDVQLIIKMRATSLPWLKTFNYPDRRVSIWKEDIQDMADVYATGDCFVFPSFGEGWGMPPREAAMMGLPVIATRWSGLEPGIDHWAMPLNNITLTPSLLDSAEGHKAGKWATPDVEEVAAKMRWCYDHREEARAKGLAAAQWLRDNQTWEHSAQTLMTLIEELVG